MDATNGIVPEYEARIEHLEIVNALMRETIDDTHSILWQAFPEFVVYPDSDSWSLDELAGMVLGDSDPAVGVVGLREEISNLQKQLQEARAACDLYENELIELRQQIDEAAIHEATVASQVASHELHIADDDDTKEMGVEPMSHTPYIAAWQGFIEELDNEDDA